ncbi:hypothetical protein FACS1894109_16940 [Spirochaetia bacterium]|nr:hypothetical protein FACS1894109_16940 [Spirochaetia bacterium]
MRRYDPFAHLVTILSEEQGRDIFTGKRLKALLEDYAKGEWRNEIRLLLRVIDSGVCKELWEAEADSKTDTAGMAWKLTAEYGIEGGTARRMVGILSLALRGECERDTEITIIPDAPEESAVPKIITDGFVFIRGGGTVFGRRSQQIKLASFYMARFAVTQDEFRDVMGYNPSYIRGGDLPVESVSWYEAVEYCNYRSERDGIFPYYYIDKNPALRAKPDYYDYDYYAADPLKWLITVNNRSKGFRLPTEAEWEYACRAGTLTDYYTGNRLRPEDACFKQERPMPVGSYPPNPWGLYDMHGNIGEWCWDNYDGLYAYRGGAYCQSSNQARAWGPGSPTHPWRKGYLGPYGIRLVRSKL